MIKAAHKQTVGQTDRRSRFLSIHTLRSIHSNIPFPLFCYKTGGGGGGGEQQPDSRIGIPEILRKIEFPSTTTNIADFSFYLSDYAGALPHHPLLHPPFRRPLFAAISLFNGASCAHTSHPILSPPPPPHTYPRDRHKFIFYPRLVKGKRERR